MQVFTAPAASTQERAACLRFPFDFPPRRNLFMSIFKNNFVVGITAALAATVLAPVLVPAIKRSGRPLAKTLVKGGIVLYEKGREAVASAGEMMEDVVAEVRAESMEGNEEADAHAANSTSGFQPQVYNGNGGTRKEAPQVQDERGGAT
jgi:hypothetical protein